MRKFSIWVNSYFCVGKCFRFSPNHYPTCGKFCMGNLKFRCVLYLVSQPIWLLKLRYGGLRMPSTFFDNEISQLEGLKIWSLTVVESRWWSNISCLRWIVSSLVSRVVSEFFQECLPLSSKDFEIPSRQGVNLRYMNEDINLEWKILLFTGRNVYRIIIVNLERYVWPSDIELI